MSNKIGIIGSINTDLIIKTDTLPQIGETVIGSDFKISFGGKGANEAVAAARLGANVNLLSCVGDDLFSKNMLKHLKNEGINTTAINQIKNCNGGIAGITIANNNNQIIVIPGANGKVDKKYIDNHYNKILECSTVGGQFEIPIPTLLLVSQICKKNNITFVLNPSPIQKFPQEIFDNATFVIVNEIEIQHLKDYDKDNPLSILKKYPQKLILTKGKDGCIYCEDNEIINIPAIKTKVIDTTGAGDTFMGAFMFAINNKLSFKDSIVFANICAGLKTTKLGAQTGMPNLIEVKNYINSKKIDISLNF